MKRDLNIELFRCLSMFGICISHSIGVSDYKCEALRNIFLLCTTCFVFISGWYGVRFSLKKIVHLVGVAFYAALVVSIGEWLIFDTAYSIHRVVRIACSWWFLNVYLLLLIASPVLNCIVHCAFHQDVNVRRDAWLAIVLIWIFVYAYAWPIECGVHLPRFSVASQGNSHSIGMMSAVYLLARVCRLSNVADYFSRKKILLIGLIILCAFLCTPNICLAKSNSLIAALFSCALFMLFKEVKVKSELMKRLVAYVSPSMFFVYLYHSMQTPGFRIVLSFERWLTERGVSLLTMWLFVAMIIFACGVLLDSPRRVVLSVIFKTRK